MKLGNMSPWRQVQPKLLNKIDRGLGSEQVDFVWPSLFKFNNFIHAGPAGQATGKSTYQRSAPPDGCERPMVHVARNDSFRQLIASVFLTFKG